MAEYIKRDEAIKLIREDKVEITPNLLTIAMLAAPNGYSAEDCYKAINDTCDRHIKEIKSLPAADVVERKNGKWIWDDEGFHCSECLFHANGNTGEVLSGVYKYCPLCGSELEVET